MDKNYSTFAIAQMLHVDPGSVANWIDQNLLKAYRTPGGHRRVAAQDLVNFLREHKMPIPSELQTTPTRVLVVDDEMAVAQLISRAIQAVHNGLEVSQAHDGFSAGAMVTSLKPNVVVLDLRMPGMDGFEVCRNIKSNPDTRHTHVIAVTAYPSPDNVKRILQCGAKACLSKPLDMESLLKEISAAMS
ncbi:MAG: response regulator [Planctomycetes bacterium]|nr:response regulator [Planctomycetota bacterium]